MPIEEHKNLGLENVGPRGAGALAAGSSNSNSHNAGGGELTKPELEQVLSQLSDLLPQLQRVAEQRSAPQ
jgi:hypothetical protein